MTQLILNTNSAWLSFSGSALVLFGTSIYSIKIFAFLLYLSGFILLVLSIALFREEKELQSSQVAIIIKQKQVRDEQPQLDEATVIASLAMVIILLGSVLLIKRTKFDVAEWIGLSLYILGWIGLGFSASMHNNALTSVQDDRLSWTLSGGFLVVVGSLLFVLSHLDPGLIIATIGFICFTLGNVQVV
jgi:Ca2+/Na+ antiporter